MNNRRKLVVALGAGAFVVPFRSLAQHQPAKARRIGLLVPNTRAVASLSPRIAAFLQGLREFGWIEGQNLAIERRFAEGQLERLAELAAELVSLKVDVIVTAASPSARAAKNATGTIPVVILDPGDPVGSGLVDSLARPGGNVTGLSSVAPDLAGKRLGLLKETVPRITRVAVLFNAAIPPADVALNELQVAAKLLGINILSAAVHGSKNLEETFGLILAQRADGLLVFPDPLTFSNQEAITSFAAKSRIPALFGAREFVETGGLLSYGPSYADMFRRGAYFVDKILKGAKPADLPVEQPTKFELIINGKTAKALGLAIPQSLLISADKVIE
jgi:putative ABC transport system substrate-binding protein